MLSDTFTNLREWHNDGMQKRVYDFTDGTISDSALLGMKGAYLCEMYKHHLPVPPGFVITTEACLDFFAGKTVLGPHLKHNLHQSQRLVDSEKKAPTLPLLLSVRSSPDVALPGMTDTILNLGINDHSCALLANYYSSTKFALDVHQRFLLLFGTIVMHVPRQHYEDVLSEARTSCGVAQNQQLDVSALQAVVRKFKALAEVPDDPHVQLGLAVEAIFCSSQKHSAAVYRSLNEMDTGSGAAAGTVSKGAVAVIVQEMVFGNLNKCSCTGVAFSRDPETGDPFITGEFVQEGQGEDVYRGMVAGCREHQLLANTPHIDKIADENDADKWKTSDEAIHDARNVGENMLTSLDYLKVWGAIDAEEVNSGGQLYCQLLRSEYCMSYSQNQLAVRLELVFILPFSSPTKVPEEEGGIRGAEVSISTDAHVLGAGMGKGVGVTGIITGLAVFSAEGAQRCYQANQACILIQQAEAIALADGVICLEGGSCCHLVEISRPLNRPCVVGVGAASGWTIQPISPSRMSSGVFDAVGHLIIQEGKRITMDGRSGYILDAGGTQEQNLKPPQQKECGSLDFAFYHLLRLADRFKNIQVFGDVSTPDEAMLNSRYGSIMLVRLSSLLQPVDTTSCAATTHYLFDQARDRDTGEGSYNDENGNCAEDGNRGGNGDGDFHPPALLRQQTLVESTEEVLTSKLHELYVASAGRLVSVLLSSPPSSVGSTSSSSLPIELHLAALERTTMKEAVSQQHHKVSGRAKRETLHTVYQQTVQLEVRAVLKAGLRVINDGEKRLGLLQFLVPLRGGLKWGKETEEAGLIALLHATAQEVFDESGGLCVPYSLGVMVQTPRACLLLDTVAINHPTISTVMFDIDALTELMFGMRKGDMERIIIKKDVGAPHEGEIQMSTFNPFERLDKAGVGSLLTRAVKLFRTHEQTGQQLTPMGCCGRACCVDPSSVRFLLEGVGWGGGGVDMAFLCGPPATLPVAKSRIRALKRTETVDAIANNWHDTDLAIASPAPFQSDFW